MRDYTHPCVLLSLGASLKIIHTAYASFILELQSGPDVAFLLNLLDIHHVIFKKHCSEVMVFTALTLFRNSRGQKT